MIVIGASLGGMKALRTVLRPLPKDFPHPIAVVLHRHREADGLLVEILRRDTQLPVEEAEDKQPIEKGRVVLAPPDYHLLVEPGNFSLSTDDPVQYARPSIDVLFESAADIYGPALIAVILTGANHDGAHGAARVQEKGGMVIVQDPLTAESSVMPLAALEATGTGNVFAPEKISEFLLTLAQAEAGKA